MVSLLLPVIYLAFISLGLPDSLLGTAWPLMYRQFDVPVSWAGAVSMTICVGTVVSSLQSDRLTLRWGAGRVTAVSVALTAAGLLGFSFCRSYWLLFLWALPYGLGAGSVDAALNNYVALHYASRHMSWLHCMWGVGASIGPILMGHALSGGYGWPAGYRIIGGIQACIALVVALSLPLWKTRSPAGGPDSSRKAMSLGQILRIPGAKSILSAFFCYCGAEQTTFLWTASYMVLHRNMGAEQAAGVAALFYAGMTLGRLISGFLTLRLSDPQMIHLGTGIAGVGLLLILLPLPSLLCQAGFFLLGLGFGPVYPCIIHSTPELFGEENSQAVIGVQMASAYSGSCLMPPVFGVLAQRVTPALFPFFLAVLILGMILLYRQVLRLGQARTV